MNVVRQLRCSSKNLFQSNWSQAFLKLNVRTRRVQTQTQIHHFNSRCSNETASNGRMVFAIVNNYKNLLFIRPFRTQFSGQQRFVSNTNNVHGNSKMEFTISDINKNIPENILVFSHDNGSFYKFISLFGVFQMILFSYFALSPVQNLRPGPVIIKDTTDMPWWKRWLYKEGQYKNAISGIFLTVGASILFVSIIYPQRAVKQLWLLKGGKHIKITTHSLFEKSKSFSVVLDNVNCLQARTGDATQIPLKIKDKAFFFLMDKQGTFHHSEMFDFVIGLKRTV